MAQPTASEVHVDGALTDISVAYSQKAENFVAGSVFPSVPVQSQTDKYFTFDKNDWFRDDAVKKRSPEDESAGSGFGVDGTNSYSCDVWATHIDVNDQLRANADPAVPVENAASELVTQRMLIRRERLFATDYFSTGVWGTDVVGGTDFTAWDDAASDPETDVANGKEAVLKDTGLEPNKLVVAYSAHMALKRHPLIKDRFKYTTAESITAQMLARFFEVDEYVVSKASYATNEEGATTGVHAFALGQNALLCYSTPTPGIMVPNAAYNFTWAGLTGMNDLGIAISNIDMRGSGKKVDRIEGEFAFDMKVVGSDLGYFFSGVTS